MFFQHLFHQQKKSRYKSVLDFYNYYLSKNINAITTKTTLFIKHLPSVPNFGTFLLVTETIQISVTTNHTYVHIHGNCIVYMYSPPCVFETTDFTDLYSNSARWYVLFFLIMIAVFSNTLICIH